MSTTVADQKRRIVLPGAKPGDVFGVQIGDAGHYTLVKLTPPKARTKRSPADVKRAMAKNPLRPSMSWNALKAVTRDL